MSRGLALLLASALAMSARMEKVAVSGLGSEEALVDGEQESSFVVLVDDVLSSDVLFSADDVLSSHGRKIEQRLRDITSRVISCNGNVRLYLQHIYRVLNLG